HVQQYKGHRLRVDDLERPFAVFDDDHRITSAFDTTVQHVPVHLFVGDDETRSTRAPPGRSPAPRGLVSFTPARGTARVWLRNRPNPLRALSGGRSPSRERSAR